MDPANNRTSLLINALKLTITISYLSSCHPALADNLNSIEIQDRRVDQAALQAQESAEQKLKSLLIKYKNTSHEPALMMRLADIYHQSAEMEFRIAHGKAYNTKAQIHLAKYNKILTSLIEITTNLIEHHSDFSGIDQCLFMSAKAHEELGHKEPARLNYLKLIHSYSDSPEALPSYMALADLAIEKNQHLEAIKYLLEIEKNSKSPYYPFAIHKLAWSNYNLKNFDSAFNWIEKSANYYDQLIQRNSKVTDASKNNATQASDLAMRENILMDAVLFFDDGFEAGNSRFELKSALDSFRNLEKGPLLGKMNLRFAKLLRAHQKDQDLLSWEQTVMKKEINRTETIQVVTTLFEHLWSQNLYDQMVTVGRDIELSYKAIETKERETEGVISARKLILEVTNKLHEMGKKANKPEQTASILSNLSKIYSIFLSVLPENDPRAPEAHYNLAEAQFSGKEFEKATEHYNWILSHFNNNSKLDLNEIAIKAISSRYEGLRNDKLIPVNLAAAKIDNNGDPNGIKNLPKKLAEWIGWIENFINRNKSQKNKKDNSEIAKNSFNDTIENFQFEGNRAIYHGGLIKLATNRMIEFSNSHPRSKFAIPSITLALDTYIMTEDWAATSDLATKLLNSSNWTNTEFSKHLQETAADASYKQMELFYKDKNYQLAITQTKSFITNFKKTQRAPDFIMLAAQSSIKLDQKNPALEYLSLLINDYGGTKAGNDALLARAQISEEFYDFESALKDYRTYLITSKNETISKRVYFLEWLKENATVDCSKQVLNDCARYRALSFLRAPLKSPEESSKIADVYMDQAINGDHEDRPIFSAVALKYSAKIELHRRLVLLRSLASGWDKLDPMVRLSTLPILNELIPESFTKARLDLKIAVPMKTISSKSITLRAEWIKELEKTAEKILELPWNGIRSQVLGQLSLAYSDFTTILAVSSPPKDLTEPQLKEYQSGVNEIIQPFQLKSGQLQEKSKTLAISSNEQISISLLEKLDPKTKWVSGLKTPEANTKPGAQTSDIESRLKLLWLEAYSSHSWAKNAFILQELQQKKLTTPSVLSVMKGLTLAASGAKTEAWLEVKPAIEEIKLAEKLAAEAAANAAAEASAAAAAKLKSKAGKTK